MKYWYVLPAVLSVLLLIFWWNQSSKQADVSDQPGSSQLKDSDSLDERSSSRNQPGSELSARTERSASISGPASPEASVEALSELASDLLEVIEPSPEALSEYLHAYGINNYMQRAGHPRIGERLELIAGRERPEILMLEATYQLHEGQAKFSSLRYRLELAEADLDQFKNRLEHQLLANTEREELAPNLIRWRTHEDKVVVLRLEEGERVGFPRALVLIEYMHEH